MADDEWFTITDGVRRAKAAEKLGHQEISAEVWENDVPIGSRSVELDKLYSEKPVVETSGSGFARWRKAYRAVQQGASPGGIPVDPIKIKPGAKGIPLTDVIVEGVDDIDALKERA